MVGGETSGRDGLVSRAAEIGGYLVERLRALTERMPAITDVRGLGLMVAVDLSVDAAQVITAARDRGLLVNAVQPKTLRFAPPLIVTHQEVDQAVDILDGALAAVVQPAAAG